MLLWLLSCVNLKLRSTSIFMSTFYNFIHNVLFVNVMAHASALKISLIFLIASVGADFYENNPSLVSFCDDSSMHLNVEFTKPFNGLLFTSGDQFNPSCSFPTSLGLNNTKLMLTLPFRRCTFDVSELDEDTILISGTILVQQHRMLKTSYDTSLNVTCVHALPMDTFRAWYYPNITLTAGHLYTDGSSTVPKVISRLETKIGSDLFPDDLEVEADLFLVVSIGDGGRHKDMSIQNCIAHDDEVLNNETLIYQLSDVLGCPNASYTLKNFIVSNQTDGISDLMAYTRLEYLSLMAIGELFVSCGVVLCEHSCHINCESNGLWRSQHLNDIIVKKFVRRHPAATVPSSLEDFDRRQIARISKRSVGNDWFSRKNTLISKETISGKNVFAENNETVRMQTKDDVDIVGTWDDLAFWVRISIFMVFFMLWVACYYSLSFWTRIS